jgi:hypothetical protein
MLRVALLVPLLLVGLASFVFVRVHADDGASLVTRQQDAQALTRSSVADVVKAAPDPVAHERGASATCVPLGSGVLPNPWRCAIKYRSGRDIQYTVTISANGSYVGDDQFVRYRGRSFSNSSGEITGCCINVP